MIPIPLQPPLILSAPVRLDGQPNLESLLLPGEAVRATVLNVQDDGSLLLLLKGVTLSAASLVGRLPVGTMVEAHVELKDGQVLLRLDQPQQASPALPLGTEPADPFAASRPGGLGGASATVALLKALLPADQPLASSLAKLTASLMVAAERGDLAPPTVARFETLARTILLAPDRLDGPVAGDRIREALLALGVQHERALLSEWSKAGTLMGQGQAPNLKALLMALLAEAGVEEPRVLAHDVLPAATAGQSPVPQPSVATVVPPLYDVALVRGTIPQPSIGTAGQQGAVTEEFSAPDQPHAAQAQAQTFVPLPAVEPVLVPTEPVVFAKSLPGDRESVAQRDEPPSVRAPASSSIGQPEGSVEKAPATSAPTVPTKPATPSGEETGRSVHLVVPSKAWAAIFPAGVSATNQGGIIAKEEMTKQVGASSLSGTDESAGAGRGGWIRDAQQVLTVIERTQALAVLNGQAGQLIPFEIPLAGGGQAWFYVEERTAGQRRSDDQPRTFSIVTLLKLDGLGSVRVDTLLTGKRLSARFLLDEPDVRQRIAGYLPALNSSLSAKGYQVDVLATDVGEPKQVRGEDLRVRSLPRINLVNRRV